MVKIENSLALQVAITLYVYINCSDYLLKYIASFVEDHKRLNIACLRLYESNFPAETPQKCTVSVKKSFPINFVYSPALTTCAWQWRRLLSWKQGFELNAKLDGRRRYQEHKSSLKPTLHCNVVVTPSEWLLCKLKMWLQIWWMIM